MVLSRLANGVDEANLNVRVLQGDGGANSIGVSGGCRGLAHDAEATLRVSPNLRRIGDNVKGAQIADDPLDFDVPGLADDEHVVTCLLQSSGGVVGSCDQGAGRI